MHFNLNFSLRVCFVVLVEGRRSAHVPTYICILLTIDYGEACIIKGILLLAMLPKDGFAY